MKVVSTASRRTPADRAVSSGEASWQRLAGGLPQPLDHMAYVLLTHPEAPGNLYAGLADGKVWHSSDYGDSWRLLPLDLPGSCRAMVPA